MEHWDVKMAFTHALLEDEIYMYQPEGYEVAGKEKCVCFLKKSLYGLKQSARNWQLLLKSYFLQIGFLLLASDACIFFAKKGDAWCICSTHVDDIFVLYNQAGRIFRDNLFSAISKDLPMENLGPVSWALKTLILRHRVSGVLKISQEQYYTIV